jgi:serine phosphatase RsbU (regulator of sigma subunit)/pSer/pThr/pTyr-binding forkhead associated (FHA) protein
MAVLKKVTGESAGQLIELKAEPTVIGRAPECTIVLDSTGVSRRHAELRRQGEAFALVDLNSRNKTKLNGRVLDPDVAYTIAPNDRIEICDVVFAFYLAPPKESSRRAGTEELRVDDRADVNPLALLDASRSSALTSTVRPEVKLAAILDIARNLSRELEIDAVAPKILDSLMQLFPQAERAFLVLVEAESGRLIRKAFKHKPHRRTGLSQAYTDEVPMSISRSIVNHVIHQKRAVLSQDAGNDKDLPTSASIADLKIRSVMCVPLLTPDGQALGIIQLDTSDRKQFLQDDLDVLAAVASQAAIALQNAQLHENLLARERLDRDLKIAEQVQRRFLPQTLPTIPGYEFFAYYHATYEVGGDYYDFVPLPGNRLGIALGDVSGKGVAAALMMAKFSGDTRLNLRTEETPSAAAGVLNNTLCAAGIDEKFITLSLSVLDAGTGRLRLCSAGHLPLLLRRADGTVEELGEDVAGFPLGILPDTEYQQIEVELRPGDVAVVYSDGVTDSRSPTEELYDTKENRRLLKRVKDSPGGAEAVGKAILQDIREFSRGHAQADDITLVTFGPKAK